MALDKLLTAIKGGAGSGNFGHGGRPGKRGGSTPKGGGSSSMSNNLPFEVTEPRSFREHSNLSYVRNLYARDLSKALGGQSAPNDIAGAYETGIKTATFVTKKSTADAEKALADEGFVKSGDAWYLLSTKYGQGTKAELKTIEHKSSFYGPMESWTQVELSGVIQK